MKKPQLIKGAKNEMEKCGALKLTGCADVLMCSLETGAAFAIWWL
jgi:hypothetical protein